MRNDNILQSIDNGPVKKDDNLKNIVRIFTCL